MKKTFLILLAITIFYSCNDSKKENTETKKIFFSDIQSQIKKYKTESEIFWKNNDGENSSKYNDSIRTLILNSYISNHEFNTVDDSIYNTSVRKKPLFLQVTASWCAPCKFQIPALNKIVEKYSDKVDFVLLFWDTKPKLEKLVTEYNKKIILIPSKKRQSESKIIDIAGFKHIMSFPTNYLITRNNKIINFSSGAMMPTTYKDHNGIDITITEEEANKQNYERLEREIKELIE
jgi:thiol-disulfide isomerase/thioredoxin